MKDQRTEKYRHNGCSHNNIDLVYVRIVEEPKTSVNRRFHQARLRETKTWPALRNSLVLTLCEVQLYQRTIS